MPVWRMVEAQHIASTLKIVDTQDEQEVLERLLENSKPAKPKTVESLDYLLATPFRYDPLPGGSRFRAATDPGVFYGAESVRTASAELGYWRWRFLKDTADLERLEPVAHTAFRVDVSTEAIDLRQPPFIDDAKTGMHPADYSGTQRMAQCARQVNIGAIVYPSVRDPVPAWCVAVLTPTAFTKPRPSPGMQTGWLAVHHDGVIWRRDKQSISFLASGWK